MIAALLLLLGLSPAHSAEVQEIFQKAYQDYLRGQLEEAVKDYRYLSLLGITSPDPDLNMAVLSKDMGRPDAALPLWVKSSLSEGADGFIWNQRGWSYLSCDRTKEAKDSFLKAIERSSTTATQAEANLGIGMASILDFYPKAALGPLREALVQSPYIISAAAQQTAIAALAAGEKQSALAYFRQSVEVDPFNLEAIKQIAKIYQKIGENKSAWWAYYRALSLDPEDLDSAMNIKKVAEYIVGNTELMRPIRRLSRPLLDASGKGSLDVPPSSETIRVALFSKPDGKPGEALRVYFMPNADFRVTTAGGEVIKEDGKAYDQWEIAFRPENNIVEVRDTARNIQYTSKQPFRIVPQARRGSVLLKSAEFAETYGFDAGDRETRGAIEVIPTPYGFMLVNDLPLEDYLYGAVAAALPQGTLSEAYKAQAVYARTTALWHKANRKESYERSDICDSSRCQKYLGLNEEMLEATKAVAATEGVALKFNGQYARLLEHQNCGGVTEDAKNSAQKGVDYLVSVYDGPRAMATAHSPVELERWIHEYPPRDRYCEAGSLTPAAESRWVRVLDAEAVKARAERIKFIGAITHLRATRRSPSGRVQALEIIGTRDTLALEGENAIEEVLSPNSLRSTLFTIQPLIKRGKASHFILWGAGTGHGLGLCLAGTIGQASLGRTWNQILSHYFPGLKIEGFKSRDAAFSHVFPSGRKRLLNPKRKKK